MESNVGYEKNKERREKYYKNVWKVEGHKEQRIHKLTKKANLKIKTQFRDELNWDIPRSLYVID